MENLITGLVQGWGAPATGAAVVYMLIKLNNTVKEQKDAMLALYHGLDKRVTVIESARQ
ncbi:hypothetical protein I6M59_10340 [Shewanella algae]|uniref:Uncharacterized protein n=1 Tax=Shewanella carassii TaxID=1987584 RepID=A0ABQ1SWA9_9GAMM|nr:MULTISPECIES: hypothetical protein [Shewanella]MBO2692142.1 hypothetical protein [Shewanella algae]GGE65448.1 hypothetical protein GCM10011520_02760 [Shewanella carassii]